GAYVERGFGDGVDPAGASFERQRGFRTDHAAGGQAHVGDDNVRTGVRHRGRLRRVENIRGRQEVLLVGQPDHLNLQRVAHSGLFQIPAEDSVDQSDGWEILHSGETDSGDTVEEGVEPAKGVGAIYSREHGRFL